MSEKEELAKLLFIADNFGADKTEAAVEYDHLLHAHGAVYTQPMADAVIAAGYRKPRQITTVEELDALPVRSVVLHGGRSFQRYPVYPAAFDEYQKWKCADGGFVRSTKDGSSILPATVLWEPLP